MPDLLEAAKRELPGLTFSEDSDDGVRWISTESGDVGISHGADGFTPWFCEDNNGPTVDTPVIAAHWIRTQVVARRDALDSALGQGWIPVSERLPELDVTVIIATPDGRTQVAERSMDGDEWLWAILRNGSMWLDDVQPTHWRYIPASPEVR